MSTISVVGTFKQYYEVVDTRLIIHFSDAAEKGMKNIIIRTVDSDILIKALGMFELITPKHDNKYVCVGF